MTHFGYVLIALGRIQGHRSHLFEIVEDDLLPRTLVRARIIALQEVVITQRNKLANTLGKNRNSQKLIEKLLGNCTLPYS